MKRFIAPVLFLFLPIYLLAQENYQTNKVIPPSPTAASLGMYGEVPVSYYTGTANISIPLYEIKTKGVSVPVTLDYNASGIKVNQDASWVGLGWSLAAGGVITRSIRGNDDFSNGGYVTTGALPPNTVDNIYDEANPYDPIELVHAAFFTSVNDKGSDGEPDVYYYNFGGYSGSFVLGKNVDGTPALLTRRNNLKIEFSINYATDYYPTLQTGQWTITTPDGTKYRFRIPELSTNYFSNSDILSVQNLKGLEPYLASSYQESVGSWYLESIECLNGESVHFYYDIDRVSLSTISYSHKRFDYLGMAITLSSLAMQNVYNNYNCSRQLTKDVYLRKIEFNHGYVLFDRSDRIDIEPDPMNSSLKPKKLSSITIFNKSDEQIKKITLQHGYFNDWVNNVNYPNYFNYHYKRLKLESVTEYGSDNTAKNPYLFEYYDSENLPSKYSRQMDEWGYYSNFYSPILPGEVLPTLLPEVTATTNIGPKVFEGTDRIADVTGNFSKKGILVSTTYPTKGKTVYDYEVNEYQIPAYSVPTNIYLETAVSDYPNINGTGELIKNFTLSNSKSVTVQLYCNPTWDQFILPSTQLVAYLKDVTNNTVLQSFSISSPTVTLTLPAGQYALEVDEIDDYYIRLQAYYPGTPVTISSKKGGGLRIKTISNYDFLGSRLSCKRFVYTMSGTTTGTCSGLLITKPLRHFERAVTKAQVNMTNPSGYTWEYSAGYYLVRASNSNYPLGFHTAPAPVTYSKVAILEGENGEGGSTLYTYLNGFQTNYYQTYGYKEEMPVIFDSRNGLMYTKEVKHANGALLNKTTNTYTLKESIIIKGIKIFKDHGAPTWDYVNDLGYYDNISEWWALSSETKEEYFNGQAITNTTNYTYGNAAHKQVTVKESTLTDGSTITTNYSYPHDFATIAPYDEMIIKHIITPVIKESAYRNSTQLLSENRINFSKWGSYIAPQTVESKKGSSAWDIRFRYHAYDANGNITSQSNESGLKESYVWSWGKTYPFVKATNVSVTDLEAKVATVLVAKGYANGLDDLDTYLLTLGNLTTSTQISSWEDFKARIKTQMTGLTTDYNIYTYSPLIGITSVSNGNSLSKYYVYDGFGRLQHTRDNEGNILETFKYNYRQ